MNKKLHLLFDALQHDKTILLQRLQSLPESTLAYSPHDTQWSITQVLNHLLLSEQLTLAYLKKKSLGLHQLNESGMWEVIKINLLIVSQRIPLKYKAPKVLSQHTEPVLTLADITKQWDDCRQQFREFLESLSEQDTRKLLFKHPLAGKFNILQGIIFMREHILHHLPQINRLLSKAAMEKSSF